MDRPLCGRPVTREVLIRGDSCSQGSDFPRRGEFNEAYPPTSLLEMDLNGTQIVPELEAVIGSSEASIPHPDGGKELPGRTPDL